MIVGYATGEAREPPLRPTFDRRIKLEFHGARLSSDGGLLAYRELDDALGLTDVAITQLLDGRRGKNTRHQLGGLFRQSVFGRLAGYEDVNDAERLARDPAMRATVGREGLDRVAASSSQMGRFETDWLARDVNLEALTDLSGTWIDRVHERKLPRTVILDMDSSESPTHGEQEGAVWNGHFGCPPAITRSFCSTTSATWSVASCGPAMPTAPKTGAWCWRRGDRLATALGAPPSTSAPMPPSPRPRTAQTLRQQRPPASDRGCR